MRNILSLIILFFLLLNYAFSFNNNVYIGISIGEKKILLQDHILANNESLWKENEYGSIYEDYMNYIEKFLIKKGYSLADTGYLYFNEYYPEFKKLTNIKIDEEFYISTSKGVYKGIVTSYCLIPSDTYINGNIFYVVLEYKNDEQGEIDEPVVISKYENMSILNLKQLLDRNTVDNFKNIIINTLTGKKVKIYDSEEDRDKLVAIDTFYEDSFRFFKGHFTNKDEEQYIINFSQNITSEFYINTSFIADKDGNIVYKMISVKDKDYDYFVVKGIIDVDGDGLDEILADQGYYEGNGLYLYKFDGNDFIVIADGFVYGV